MKAPQNQFTHWSFIILTSSFHYSVYYIHLHDKRASLKSQHTPRPHFTVQGYTADTYADQTSLTLQLVLHWLVQALLDVKFEIYSNMTKNQTELNFL